VKTRYWYLDSETRKTLRKPLGQLFPSVEDALATIPNPTILAAVGDVVVASLLQHGVQPKVAIVDYRVARRRAESYLIDRIRPAYSQRIATRNPAGTLTELAIHAVKSAINRPEPVLVEVRGEEDLLLIPVVLYLPDSSVVLYGQPQQGVVLVHVNAETRARFQDFLNSMELVEA